jgi:hypothetical protein
MTGARLVWDTWRHILRSDALVEAVVTTGEDHPATVGLSAAERAILTDYARTPAATHFTIGMYRRGLARNALNALRLVPLTRRLLYSSELDVQAVAADFARSVKYRDDGPNFWRIAAGLVAYLATVPAFSHPVRQDVLALETAAIALVRRLGEAGPARWPESVARYPTAARPTDRYITNRAAVLASSGYDLTPWLEDPLEFNTDAELDRSPRRWLIYLPAAEAAPRYAELSARAARAFELLSDPRTAVDLSLALDALSVAEVLEVIDSLAEVGAVVPAEAA